jgi:hypothetical protein
MKRITLLLTLLAAFWSAAWAAPAETNSAAKDRMLLIDPSSMPVAAGKATLIIGPLQRTNGVFAGDYKLNVFPYFLKNQKGRLAIVVSDASLAEAGRGRTVTVTGTATASGKGGKTLPITAIATPANGDHGTLKLWFTTDGRKMTFTPTYHFAGNGTKLAASQTADSRP